MPTFQIEIARDPADPDQQWTEVASNIEAAFRACESAELTLHMMPNDAISIEVAFGEECNDVLIHLALTTPPWRHDP